MLDSPPAKVSLKLMIADEPCHTPLLQSVEAMTLHTEGFPFADDI